MTSVSARSMSRRLGSPLPMPGSQVMEISAARSMRERLDKDVGEAKRGVKIARAKLKSAREAGKQTRRLQQAVSDALAHLRRMAKRQEQTGPVLDTLMEALANAQAHAAKVAGSRMRSVSQNRQTGPATARETASGMSSEQRAAEAALVAAVNPARTASSSPDDSDLRDAAGRVRELGRRTNAILDGFGLPRLSSPPSYRGRSRRKSRGGRRTRGGRKTPGCGKTRGGRRRRLRGGKSRRARR